MVISLEIVQALKHPSPGFLAARDALLMCLLLDHWLRVGENSIFNKTQIYLRTRMLTFERPKVDKPQKDRLTADPYDAAKAYLPTIPTEQESLFDLALISIQERVRASWAPGTLTT